jgi:hypothetical protein
MRCSDGTQRHYAGRRDCRDPRWRFCQRTYECSHEASQCVSPGMVGNDADASLRRSNLTRRGSAYTPTSGSTDCGSRLRTVGRLHDCNPAGIKTGSIPVGNDLPPGGPRLRCILLDERIGLNRND